MDVGFDAADFMEVDAGRIDASAAECVMDDRFDGGGEERGAGFGVPNNVKVDFRVEIAGHGWGSMGEGWLKPNAGKPRERGYRDCSRAGVTRPQGRAWTAPREAP